MPKLSELITGAPAVGAATAPRTMKLSQVTAQPPANPSLFRMDSDFREKSGVGVGGMLMASAKDMFGSRQGAAEYLAEQSGGKVEGTPDAPIIVLSSGERYRVNDEGIDSADVANVAGNVAAMWTPAAWLNRFAKGRQIGLAGRVGMQAPTAAAGDAALQATFDEGRVDPVRVLASGAGAGAGEALGSGIGWAANKARTLMSSGSTAKDAAANLAREAGVELTPQQATRLAVAMSEVRAGADPRAILGREEFGFLYTQGQRLAEPAPLVPGQMRTASDVAQADRKFSVLSREELLRQRPGAGEVFSAAERTNASRLDEALNTIGQRNGANGAATPAELVQGVTGKVRAQADELDTRIGEAYDVAAKGNGTAVSADAVRALPTRLTQAVRDFAPNETTTPITAKTLEQIGLATREILKGTEGGNVRGVTLRAMETQRRILNNNINSVRADNKADRAAMLAIKREFDGWLDEAVDSALVSGDPAALEAIKTARGLRAEFGRRFEGGKDSDKFIAGLLDGSRTPEELVNIALGAGQVSKTGAARFIERLRVAADGDPEVIGGLRAAHFLRLTRGANGQPLKMGDIVRNIQASEYSNASVLKALYSPAEWGEIRRLASALEPLSPKGDFARTSGSLERAARMLFQRIGGGLPIIGETIQGVLAGKSYVQAQRAINAPVKLPSYSPTWMIPATETTVDQAARD